MAADDNYDGYLDKLADTHSKRLSDALEELEDRIAAALDDAPVKAGALFDLEWAVKARPELSKIMSETYLREATSILNDYSKVSVKALDMLNEYGDFTKTSPDIIKQLQSLTFKGFEDIATSHLDTIASEVYQNTLTGRTKTEMVKSVRQSVNGVYISSDSDAIEKLVSIAKNGSTSAAAAAVKELHSVYASDRVGGNMRRYATQMAQDSLMQFDASINTQMGKEAGIDTWKYYGDLIKDSRQFCRDHVGNVYTTAEIDEIWQGSWAGKSSSDGLIARGGYNCRHHFRPYISDVDGEAEEVKSKPKPKPETKNKLSDRTPQLIAKKDAIASLSKRTKAANKGTADRSVPDKYIALSSSNLPSHLQKTLDDKGLAGEQFPVRFRPYKYKRGDNVPKMGNKLFGTVNTEGMSTETLSILSQVLKETDGISAKFKAPPIRGVNPSKSKRASASMGDGMLSVSSTYWNPIAKSAYQSKDKLLADALKAEAKRDAAQKALTESGADVESKYDAFVAVRIKVGGRAARDTPEHKEFTEANVRYTLANKKMRKARDDLDKARKLSEPKIANTYIKGGNIEDRPWSSKEFYSEPADQFRSTMFHEYGHTVHQEYWRKVSDFDDTSFERYLSQLFYSNGKRSTERGLFFPTEYSEHNHKEWWAENFSLYNMGRTDLVDKKLKELMDEMVKSEGRIKIFDGWDFEKGEYS